MNKMYAFGIDLKMDDYGIEDFLIAAGDAINNVRKPLLKKKVKAKIKRGKVHIRIKVKFTDGTKMKFKHKSPFSFGTPLMELTEQELVEQLKKQGVSMPQQGEPEGEEKVIGFDTSNIK